MFTKYTNEPNIYIYTNNIVVKAKGYYCYPSSQRNIQISVFKTEGGVTSVTDDPMDQSWPLTIPPFCPSLPPSLLVATLCFMPCLRWDARNRDSGIIIVYRAIIETAACIARTRSNRVEQRWRSGRVSLFGFKIFRSAIMVCASTR